MSINKNRVIPAKAGIQAALRLGNLKRVYLWKGHLDPHLRGDDAVLFVLSSQR